MASPHVLGTGMTSQEINLAKYSKAINTYGRNVLVRVFLWLYKGGQLGCKNYFISKYGPDDYETTFRFSDQRIQLENNPVEDYDITLLSILLQTMCDLKEPRDDPDKQKTLTFITTLRLWRNGLAHGVGLLSEEELEDKLEKVANLCQNLIKTAGKLSGQDSQVIKQFSKQISQGLKCLQEISHLEVRSRLELQDIYRQFYRVSFTPWAFYNGNATKPSLVFTRVIIIQDMTYTVGQASSKGADQIIADQGSPLRDIHINDILLDKTTTGTLPDVIILTGDGGIGKSMFLKYLLEDWTEDLHNVNGLEKYKFLFYAEIKQNNISSFDELLKNLLRDTRNALNITFERLKDLVLDLPLVIVLDGYDEHNEISHKLVKDVLALRGTNVRIIITTRPTYTQKLNNMVPRSKNTSNLVLQGISPIHHKEYINKHFAVLSAGDEDAAEKAYSEFMNHFPVFQETLGESLNIPLILNFLVLLWINYSDRVNKMTTISEIFKILQDLICDKLVCRLDFKGIQDAEEICKQFEVFYNEIAFKTLIDREFVLAESTVRRARSKCQDLGLPPVEVLSSYFSVTRRWSCTKIETGYQFFHKRMQEYSAAQYLVSRIFQRGRSYKDNVILKLLTEAELSSLGEEHQLGRHRKIHDLPDSEDEVKSKENMNASSRSESESGSETQGESEVSCKIEDKNCTSRKLCQRNESEAEPCSKSETSFKALKEIKTGPETRKNSGTKVAANSAFNHLKNEYQNKDSDSSSESGNFTPFECKSLTESEGQLKTQSTKNTQKELTPPVCSVKEYPSNSESHEKFDTKFMAESMSCAMSPKESKSATRTSNESESESTGDSLSKPESAKGSEMKKQIGPLACGQSEKICKSESESSSESDSESSIENESESSTQSDSDSSKESDSCSESDTESSTSSEDEPFGEYANDCEKITVFSKRYTNLLLHTAGIIWDTDKTELKRYVKEIIEIVEGNNLEFQPSIVRAFTLIQNFSTWNGMRVLDLVRETHNHPTVVKLASKAMCKYSSMYKEWAIKESVVSTLKPVLEKMKILPEILRMHIELTSTHIPHLKTALHYISQLDFLFGLTLSGDLYRPESFTGISDNVLRTITHESSSCKLMEFHGCLSGSMMSSLPSTLVSLSLRMTPDELAAFCECWKDTSELRNLEIVLLVEEELDPETLPTLSQRSGTIMLHVVATVTDANAKWAADIGTSICWRAFSPQFMYPKTRLTEAGMEVIIKSISEDVRVPYEWSIHIWSSQLLTDRDCARLLRKALVDFREKSFIHHTAPPI